MNQFLLLGGVSTALLFLCSTVYYTWFRGTYNVDVGLYVERVNGVPVRRKLAAKIYNDKGVRKIRVGTHFAWNMKERTAPDNDALVMQEGGRLEVNYWVDKHGAWHLMKFSKYVPIEVNFKEDGTVKEVITQEVFFAPTNESDVEFAKTELRRLWNRHKDKSAWERYGPAIVFITVAVISMLMFLIALHFASQNLQTAASAIGNAAHEVSLTKAITQ